MIGAGKQLVTMVDFGGLDGVLGVVLSPARKRAKSWKSWKSFFPAVQANLGNPKKSWKYISRLRREIINNSFNSHFVCKTYF